MTTMCKKISALLLGTIFSWLFIGCASAKLADFDDDLETGGEMPYNAYNQKPKPGYHNTHYVQARNKHTLGAELLVACFQALKLKPGSTHREKVKAYKNLAKKYHPDRPGGDTARFQAINNANHILDEYCMHTGQGVLRTTSAMTVTMEEVLELYNLRERIPAARSKNIEDLKKEWEACPF